MFVQEPLLLSGACTRYIERNQDQYVNCGEWLLAALLVKVRNSYMTNFGCASIHPMRKFAKNILKTERLLKNILANVLNISKQ